MSSGLQATILALRAALHDEGAGNDQVRDCAFEVVAAYDRAIAATTTRCAHCNHAAARADQRLALRADVPAVRGGGVS